MPSSLRPRRSRGVHWYVGRTLEAAVRGLFLLVMGVVLVVSAVLGVWGILSVGEPILWVTFTQERCEPARYGCQSIGIWVSDDGTIRKHDVALDGTPGPDGNVRASYRPTGFNNDDQKNIVHVQGWASGFVWVPWLLFAAIVWTVVVQVRQWHRRTPRVRRDRSAR
jgi:hypothetical protein